MNWNPNSKKHKVNHCGYIERPSKRQVDSNIALWATVSIEEIRAKRTGKNIQLKMVF